jgi:hypothetical protein
MCSRSFTSTPRHAGNTLSHTSHMVFPHGPRPVSHVTPPGTRHSRPARSRGRPLRTLPGHHIPPRCSCLTKSGCPGAPSACGHVTLALAPHDSKTLAPHDFTALATHDFTALAPMTPWPSRPHLGLGHSTLDHNAASLHRYANCGRAVLGHQSRRHSGYVTALGRDCRGCLRTYAT